MSTRRHTYFHSFRWDPAQPGAPGLAHLLARIERPYRDAYQQAQEQGACASYAQFIADQRRAVWRGGDVLVRVGVHAFQRRRSGRWGLVRRVDGATTRPIARRLLRALRLDLKTSSVTVSEAQVHPDLRFVRAFEAHLGGELAPGPARQALPGPLRVVLVAEVCLSAPEPSADPREVRQRRVARLHPHRLPHRRDLELLQFHLAPYQPA